MKVLPINKIIKIKDTSFLLMNFFNVFISLDLAIQSTTAIFRD